MHGLSGKASLTTSQQDSKFGTLDMHFTDTKLDTKFVDNDGSIGDQFSISKTLKKTITEGMQVPNQRCASSQASNTKQAARDRIVKYIDAKFRGHNLARLIESILKSQGYVTSNSEPGKDGGIDILAAPGALGFNEPRICVQVKSSSSFTNSRILRELQGSMQRVKATQGLLVSWGDLRAMQFKKVEPISFQLGYGIRGISSMKFLNTMIDSRLK